MIEWKKKNHINAFLDCILRGLGNESLLFVNWRELYSFASK